MHRREAVIIGIAMLAAPLVSACDTMALGDAPSVRVENASTVDFDEVSYWAGNTEVAYTDLEAGASTPHIRAEGAYGYTTTQVVVGADTVRLQVIDYVGETPLSPGRYTYVLGLQGSAGNRTLTQELRRDL